MQTNSFILQVTAPNPPLLHSTLRPKIRFPLESPFLPAISSFRAPEQECGRAVLIPLRRLRRGSLLYTCYSFNKSSHSTRVTPCLKLTPFRLLSEVKKNHNLVTYELNDLYFSPNIVRVIKSRRMRWVGHVARMGEERGVYRVLVGKPEGRRPLGRPRRRWVDNIRTDL